MKLYHGTTEEIARLALSEGLLPREASGVDTTWPDCPSREDMVYLTRAYAPYFAMTATEGNQRWGLVEIDTDAHYDGYTDEEPNIESFLYPDEDFLEQATRQRGPAPVDLSMEERTAWYRERLEGFQHHWIDSIEGLGNCAHLGEIPPECVTQVVLFDPKSNPSMTMMAADPMISILNYRLVGGTKYRALTDWFFGYPVTLAMLDMTLGDEFVAMLQQSAPEQAVHLEKRRSVWREVLANREGIELLL